MNTLFSAGCGLWQTKPFVRVSPQPCPAAGQSHNVGQGCSISLGSAWGCTGTVTPGDKPSKPSPLRSWRWHPISPAEQGAPAGLGGAGRCLPSVPGHICRRAKRKYQFLSLCMNCKATACPSFGSQFRTALRQRLCNASGLQGASINH